MKHPDRIRDSIARFERGFWGRQTLDRPPIGVAADRAWLPIGYLRQTLEREQLRPDDVTPGLARTDYEDAFAERPVISDDWMPFSAAWRAVPWLEAICGCAVRCAAGSLAPHRSVDKVDGLERAPIPANTGWLDCLWRQTAALAASVPDDCWTSTTILRGASDVLAAMRGLNEFFLDLRDDPGRLADAAARITRLHGEILDRHFSMVKPKWGGYGHIFGYWAPGPTTVLQEDALGMCAPRIYRDLFAHYTAEIARHLGPYVLFHLHSTGFRHWRDVLATPGIAGLEITVEANGPPLAGMLPALREILERSRLILMVDGHFEQLPAALRGLPHEGLYLVISDKFIASEEVFRRFVDANW